jgi:hypothetical protein
MTTPKPRTPPPNATAIPQELRDLSSHRFRSQYDRIFRKDPAAANFFLLLCELADERGRVETSPEELGVLMAARFNDPTEYALRGKAHD